MRNNDQLHNDFWNQFVKEFDRNKEFKEIFNKRKSWKKSYYDLFWNYKGIHICLRHNLNQSNISVELYIEEDKNIFKELLDKKNDIKKYYGCELIYQHTKGTKNKEGKASKIYITKEVDNLLEKECCNECIEWLQENALKMKGIVDKFIVKRNSWIITCNPLYYNVRGAFNKLKQVEWKQSVNIEIGDTVYIYITKPDQEIKYKCIAKDVNLESASRIDDSEFVLDDSNYNNYGRYMLLELQSEYEDKQYPLSELKKYGLKSVQGPSKVTEELSSYIKSVEKKVYIESDRVEDEILLKKLGEAAEGEYPYYYELEGIRRKKQIPRILNNKKVYPRDRQIAINALAHAHYLCEVDENHWTFIRKNVDINYTEPHHLIPMAYSDLFEVSLDVEENIVSLCSTCHNLLHYGRERKQILFKLYQDRIKHLKKVGLYITFDELLKMYP